MAFSGVLTRESEWAVQKEAVYGTSPGALAGTNFFKHRIMSPNKRNVDVFYRDDEANQAQGDVLSLQVGRQTADETIECDLIPNGNSTTPTAPDASLFLEATFGTKHVGTANTTTTAGSAGTDIILTAGGVAASGVAVGDIIAINQDSLGGYEMRQVATVAVGGADHIAVDRAFTTANVATGQAVKLGTTYTLSWATIVTLFLWRFNYNNLRYQIPGSIVDTFDFSVKEADKVPLGLLKFMLKGQRQIAQSSTSRPTPSTNGTQIVANPAKLWIGATKYSFVDMGLTIKTALELRNNSSQQLYPDGPKRTVNKGYWDVQLGITPLVTDTWQTIYDNCLTYTAQDVLMQFGVTPGQMVGFRAQSWRPQADEGDIGGEVSYGLKGRCLGSAGNDSVFFAIV